MGMEIGPDTGPLPEELTADELWRTSPDALLVVARGGVILAANMAARHLFGYEPGSLVTMNVDDLLPTSARETHRRQREGFEVTPAPRSMSTRQGLEGMKADGTCFPVHVSLAPLSDSSGMVIAAVRDMTQWVEAEQELRDSEFRRDIAEDHERIARDLHDTVIQELYAAGMALQALQAASESNQATRLAEIVNGLDATARTIRAVIFDLASPVHSAQGLRTRATEVVSEMTEVLGAEPRCQFVGPLDTAVPDDLVEEALAVVRETLTNVAKHAEASTVDLRIQVDRELSIEVVDDGVGLSESTERRSGLANLAARAKKHSGSFAAYRAPAGGTAIEWVIPLVSDTSET